MTLHCLVPFCRKTRRGSDEAEEWICPQHFRRVDRRLHGLYNAAHRRATAADAAPGPEDTPEKLRAYRLVTWLWRRCVRQALERGLLH